MKGEKRVGGKERGEKKRWKTEKRIRGGKEEEKKEGGLRRKLRGGQIRKREQEILEMKQGCQERKMDVGTERKDGEMAGEGRKGKCIEESWRGEEGLNCEV